MCKPALTKSSPRSRRALTTSVVVCLTLIFAACNPSHLRRDLPPPPDYWGAVQVQEPRAGEDLLIITARERAGRLEANNRLDASRDWYETVREEFANP